MRTVLIGFMVFTACGGDDRPAPPYVASGGSGSQSRGGSRAQAGEGTDAAGGGAEGEGGAGAGGDATGGESMIIGVGGSPPEPPPGICEPAATFGADVAETVGALSGVTLLSMTADEKSIAFVSADALYVADRATNSAAFSEISVPLPAGYEAASGVSLSADGRLLVLVRTDRAGFGELSRAARGQPFGAAADETRFAKINLLKGMTGQSVGWPVLSHDGQRLYQVRSFGESRVVQSELAAGDVFDFGKEIDPFTLGGDSPGKYKLLTGLSADERAIFYFNEETAHSEALFRSRPDSPFYTPADLGARRGVVPSEDCRTLYSSVNGGLVRQARE